MIIFTCITDINNSSYDVQTSMIFNTMMKKCHLNDHTRGARSHLAKANAKANFFSLNSSLPNFHVYKTYN